VFRAPGLVVARQAIEHQRITVPMVGTADQNPEPPTYSIVKAADRQCHQGMAVINNGR
jgi:hypothetical protein